MATSSSPTFVEVTVVDNNIVGGIAVIGDQGKACFVAGKFNFVGVNVFHGQVADLAILLDNSIGPVHCCQGDLGFDVCSGRGVAGIASLEHFDAVRATLGYSVNETFGVFTDDCIWVCLRGDRVSSLVSIWIIAFAVIAFVQVHSVTEVVVQAFRNLGNVRVATISSIWVVAAMVRTEMGLVMEGAITMAS